MRNPLRLAGLISAIACSVVAVRADWVKLETPDAVIYSDAKPKQVVEFAIEYAGFRHVFRELFSPPRPTVPTVVLLFREQAQFEKQLQANASWNPPRNVTRSVGRGGMPITASCDVDGVALIALSLRDDPVLGSDYMEHGNTLRLVQEEPREIFAQFVQAETINMFTRSGYFLPIWMTQGAAEAIETCHVTNRVCIVGRGLRPFDENWRDDFLLEWDRFFRLNRRSPEFADRNVRGRFNAQAWGLMHRVLFAPGGRRAFTELAEKSRTEDGLNAVQSVLVISPQNLTREIKKQLKQKRGCEIAFDAVALRSTLKPVPAPEYEVHLYRSELLFSQANDDDGIIELGYARALAPESLLVVEASARRASRNGDVGEALRLDRKAIELGTSNAMSYLRSAQQRIEEYEHKHRLGEETGLAGLEQAMAEISKARSLDPSGNEWYVFFGKALLVLPNLTQQQIDELSRGVVPGPTGETVRFYRALLVQRLEKIPDAVRDFNHVVEDPYTTAETRTAAAERLLKIETEAVVTDVEQQVQAGNFDEARRSVQKALPGVTRLSAERLNRLGAWIDEKQYLDKLEVAIEQERWTEAEALGKQFLSAQPQHSSAAAVRQMLRKAAEKTKK